MADILKALYPLKSSTPEQIVAAVSDIALQFRGASHKLQMTLGVGGNGPSNSLSREPSSASVVQLALLAILLDEVSYSQNQGARSTAVENIQKAAQSLNIPYDDVLRASRKSTALVEGFDAQ